jgi:hypothetical protein
MSQPNPILRDLEEEAKRLERMSGNTRSEMKCLEYMYQAEGLRIAISIAKLHIQNG